jgi:hypothetical protein
MVFGVVIKTVYFFVVVPGIMGMYIFIRKRAKHRIEKRILLCMSLALVYFSLVSGFIGFMDTAVIKELLMGFTIFFACFYFVHHYHKMFGDRFVVKLFLDLNKIGIIHSIILIATYLSIEFRDFLYSFIGLTKLARHYAFGEGVYLRYSGIVHSGFSFLSTTHALLLILGVWGFYMSKKKYRWSDILFFIMGQITIFISIMLMARTGIVLIIIFFCGLIVIRGLEVLCGLESLKGFRLSKKTIRLFFVIFTITLTMLFTLDLSKYARITDFAFETIIKYSESGELDASTSNVLEYQFIFPDSPFTMLFGTGNFGRSGNLPYTNSDVGYVIFIFGGGIFGIFIAYSFYYMGFYYSFRYRRLNPYLSYFIFIYFFALFILNIKDYYYVSYVGYTQMFFIAVCAFGKYIDRPFQTKLVTNALVMENARETK